MATVFVLDINGVVGEVSRRRVRNRTDGIQLPNDQVFYPNPMAPTFLQYMVQIRAPLVLWTSRMAKNAKPIENAYPLNSIPFLNMLHGEDCTTLRDSFHPIKRAASLRSFLPVGARIVFIDDSPQYIELDGNSEVIRCETYRAAENNCANLHNVADIIYHKYGKTL